jgi:transglutaminase-like putative cysteine protease
MKSFGGDERLDQQTKKNVVNFFLYTFSLLLLWEWLRPVKQLTDTDNIGVFLGFVLLSLLLAFLGLNFLPNLIIKVIYIVSVISYFHFDGRFINADWFILFLKDIGENLGFIWNYQWTQMSDSFRTLLFFIFLWMVAYLIRYWLISRKGILLFFLMTIIFITVLDTFTPYNANGAIIRSVIAGFAIMGMLTIYRLAESENIHKKFLHTRKWMVSLAVMIAASTTIAFAAPKADPVWPDPVPFITSLNSSAETALKERARAGYRSDDSQLGGPFTEDDSVVFRAEVESPHYWKVETRDSYTGKGWVSLKGDELPVDFNAETPPPPFSFYEKVPTNERTSTVYNEVEYSHIQYPHGLQKIIAGQPYLYRVNQQTTRISPMEQKAPESYTVEFNDPVFQVEDLKAGSPEKDNYYLDNIKDTYTQLPENLPAGIKELALEITEGEETWFDKAKAIENYFHTNGFVYDRVNVAIPEKNDDYVAQFLFETKRGYCDNFSTSMAVLLRTLDIPTRWVKGYTEGESVETLESGNRTYEVTNNNAHSWVEVYFPEIGWVPFEPTKGFSNNVSFQSEETTEVSSEAQEEQKAEAEAQAPTQPETEPEESGKNMNTDSNPWRQWPQGAWLTLTENWGKILAGAVLLLGIAFVMYCCRVKWLPFYYIFIFKWRKGSNHFPKAYLALLDQLERFGFKRGKEQTLREYARDVDQFFSNKAMGSLTERYEQYLYGGRLHEGTWEELQVEWESIMKRTRA